MTLEPPARARASRESDLPSDASGAFHLRAVANCAVLALAGQSYYMADACGDLSRQRLRAATRQIRFAHPQSIEATQSIGVPSFSDAKCGTAIF
jgi:hypothetical protein